MTSDAVARTRPLVEYLFARERERRGSKMSAYSAVGAMAGTSESWVRRLLGRRHVAIELQTYLNLAEAYRRACDRIQAERDLERSRFVALRAEADAALQADQTMVVGALRADR